MKLTDLNPRWFVLGDNDQKLGLTFDCPHCIAQRLGVVFHHAGREAIDDAEINTHTPGVHIWSMTGEDFHDLSLSPSVDASAAGHWHGFITNGEIK